MITEAVGQRLGKVGVVYPASINGESLTGAVDISKAAQFYFDVTVGTLGTNATVDAVIKGATTSNGTYTAINSTAITQLTAANTSGKTSVKTDSINALGLGYKYIKGSITVGTAASVVSGNLYAADADYEPASGLDLNTVTSNIIL